MDFLDREKIKMAVEELQKNEDLLIECAHSSAKILKIYYEALQDEGFTKEEALTLVAKHGISLGNIKNKGE